MAVAARQGAVAAVRPEHGRSVIASSLVGGSEASTYSKIQAPGFVYSAEENFSHAQRWSWSGLEEAHQRCRNAALGPEKRGAASLGHSQSSAKVNGKELQDKFLLLEQIKYLFVIIAEKFAHVSLR